jgi:phosphomannomutase
MTLIKSVSGIRGTIGGSIGENLTPIDIVKFTTAFVHIIRKKTGIPVPKIIVGRDSRKSGSMLTRLVIGTLQGMGARAVDIGQATTPTVEIAVTEEKSQGGIILTASHNPKQWNALKLLNELGEFFSEEDGRELMDLIENHFDEIKFSTIDKLIEPVSKTTFLSKHISLILENQWIDVEAIRLRNFSVVVDAVNSVGGIAVPALLKALGVKKITELNCVSNGEFAHNPEPIPENLTEISEMTKRSKADIGFVVDPDVDRLAVVNEDGTMFGEEYTLVAVADYILSKKPGNTVSNLSSSRALADITKKYGGTYSAAAVGEANVVAEMKKTNAIIGGEGNGGVIFPELHYGRDALVGIAIFLTALAKSEKKCSQFRAEFPNYFISKNKIQLTEGVDIDTLLAKVKKNFSADKKVKITDIDGVKLDFENGWVHLRKSNTEPIIRVYAESSSPEKADELAQMIINKVKG